MYRNLVLFGLEILGDVEGSKSIATEGSLYFRLPSRYNFTSFRMQLSQLLSQFNCLQLLMGMVPQQFPAATGCRFLFSPLYQQHFSNLMMSQFNQVMWLKTISLYSVFSLGLMNLIGSWKSKTDKTHAKEVGGICDWKQGRQAISVFHGTKTVPGSLINGSCLLLSFVELKIAVTFCVYRNVS